MQLRLTNLYMPDWLDTDPTIAMKPQCAASFSRADETRRCGHAVDPEEAPIPGLRHN